MSAPLTPVDEIGIPRIAERRRQALGVLYVATEAVVWFMVLRVIASFTEGAFWREVALNLERALVSGDLADPQRAQELLPAVHAADGAYAVGPAPVAVLLAAIGAFALARGLTQWRLDGALGAAVILLGSVLALNVLLRVAIGGDWRLWDMSGLTGFFEQREANFASELDLDAFVADPSFGQAHGGAIAVSLAGLTAVWLRFLLAARGIVTFERVLRSASIGFVVVLVMLVVGAAVDAPGVARYALLHFVLVVVTLAVANNARAMQSAGADEPRRTAPWFVAVGGTVAVLTGVALLIGMLAYVNAGVVFSMIGGIALRIIEFLLMLIITPLYWLLETVLGWFFPDGLPGMDQEPGPPEAPGEAGLAQGEGRSLPGWIMNALQFAAVLVIAVGLYRFARWLVRRRRDDDGAGEPVRSSGSGGAGLGDLLRDLLPGNRSGRRDGAWMDRHPVYRLYGRTVVDAHERGFRLLEGETPLEFSSRAAHALEAPFEPVGRAFDRARYGRHFPPEADVRAMEVEVQRWEVATPATPELRERMGGAAPMDEATAGELRIQRNRYLLRGDIEKARRIEIEDTRG